MNRLSAIALSIALLAGLACSGTSPDDAAADFVADLDGERFVVRSTNPETIARMREALAGRRRGFPAGPLRRGDGGFNAPWSWHIDPAELQLVEFAIEVCDGRPSYVETHLDDFPTYCPWGARIVREL